MKVESWPAASFQWNGALRTVLSVLALLAAGCALAWLADETSPPSYGVAAGLAFLLGAVTAWAAMRAAARDRATGEQTQPRARRPAPGEPALDAIVERLDGALRESEWRYRALFEQVAVGVTICDLGLRYEQVNDRFCEMTGYRREDLLRMSARDIFSPPYGAEGSGAAESGAGRSRFDPLRRKDGSRLWVSSVVSAVRDASGEAQRYVAVIQDVTEQKHAEDALRAQHQQLARFNAELETRVAERTAQLEEANRELEAFTYSVSHDLRAPLRAIEGFSESVMEACAGKVGPRVEDHLRRLGAGGRRMTRLIDSLLELSRTGRAELRRRPVDVSGLALEIAAELRETEPGRSVDLVVSPGMTAVADSDLLRVVLDNLLRNAWKFTRGRGDAAVGVGCERSGEGAVYFVRDNGAGFDMGSAGRLFTPFQRLHGEAEFPGDGIGLAIAARVVRRHGGEIWARAEPGGGAMFRFTLDAHVPATEPGGPAAGPAGASAPEACRAGDGVRPG